MAVVKHPSAQKRFAALCARFQKLRQAHEAAVNRMWAGTLATGFTDEELDLLSDVLSPHDRALMKKVREPHGGR